MPDPSAACTYESEADRIDRLAKDGEYDLPAKRLCEPPSYEADERGRVYEKLEDGSVWPTGVVWMPFATRNDITHEEFGRMLRTERT